MIVRWDANQHALRTLSNWNGVTTELESSKTENPIESEVIISLNNELYKFKIAKEDLVKELQSQASKYYQM